MSSVIFDVADAKNVQILEIAPNSYFCLVRCPNDSDVKELTSKNGKKYNVVEIYRDPDRVLEEYNETHVTKAKWVLLGDVDEKTFDHHRVIQKHIMQNYPNQLGIAKRSSSSASSSSGIIPLVTLVALLAAGGSYAYQEYKKRKNKLALLSPSENDLPPPVQPTPSFFSSSSSTPPPLPLKIVGGREEEEAPPTPPPPVLPIHPPPPTIQGKKAEEKKKEEKEKKAAKLMRATIQGPSAATPLRSHDERALFPLTQEEEAEANAEAEAKAKTG